MQRNVNKNTRKENAANALMLSTSAKNYSSKPISMLHEFYMCEEVVGSGDYVDWIDIISEATENDIVKIRINSYGGDLFAALQISNAITECRAKVITSVEGACMSAATLVFLNSDEYHVSPHAAFMFHNYSGFVCGKGGEMYSQVSFEKQWMAGIVDEYYNDFLTKKEIKRLLTGEDIWMTGEKVVKRLNKKAKKLAVLMEVDKDETEEIPDENNSQLLQEELLTSSSD